MKKSDHLKLTLIFKDIIFDVEDCKKSWQNEYSY